MKTPHFVIGTRDGEYLCDEDLRPLFFRRDPFSEAAPVPASVAIGRVLNKHRIFNDVASPAQSPEIAFRVADELKRWGLL